MNALIWIFLVAGVVVFLGLKKFALVAPAKAGQLLELGAVVIDVRSPEEYRRRHLAGTVNVPMAQLRDEIRRHAPDSAQAVLLHCLSGGRSGMARGILRQMGYHNAHNLGSYGRAEKILAAHHPDLSGHST